MSRITKNDLKHDAVKDALTGFLLRSKDYFLKYKEKIGIGILVVGVVVLVFIISTLTASRSNRESLDLFNKALYSYTNTQDGQRYYNAKQIFELLLQKYPSAKVSKEARFLLGNCYYFFGEYDQAIDTFKKSIKNNKAMEPYLLQSLGKCYEGKQDYDAAVKTYKTIVKKYPKHFLKSNIMLDIGTCLEKLGKKDEAVEVYKDIVKTYPDSFWAREAAVRLNFFQIEQS